MYLKINYPKEILNLFTVLNEIEELTTMLGRAMFFKKKIRRKERYLFNQILIQQMNKFK